MDAPPHGPPALVSSNFFWVWLPHRSKFALRQPTEAEDMKRTADIRHDLSSDVKKGLQFDWSPRRVQSAEMTHNPRKPNILGEIPPHFLLFHPSPGTRVVNEPTGF